MTKSEQSTRKKGKKSNRQLTIIAIIMASMILLFAAGLYFKDRRNSDRSIDEMYRDVLSGKESDDAYMYRGYIFVKSDNLWYTQLQKAGTLYNIPFHYSPRDVEHIEISGDALSFGRGVIANHSGNVYITFDPLSENLKYIALANGELSFSTVQTFGWEPVAACTRNETPGCIGAPIVDCGMTSIPVILLKQGQNSVITVDGNCLIIQGMGEDLIKSTDRLLFEWYGII